MRMTMEKEEVRAEEKMEEDTETYERRFLVLFYVSFSILGALKCILIGSKEVKFRPWTSPNRINSAK